LGRTLSPSSGTTHAQTTPEGNLAVGRGNQNLQVLSLNRRHGSFFMEPTKRAWDNDRKFLVL
jgi:hypothetical protein